jgi:hypothetical protein
MSEVIIEPTPINIYGVNAFINKFPDNKLDILNLQNLKNEFELDYKFNEETNEIDKTELPAFTQLTFNERVAAGDSSYSTSYHRPPFGPIENFCYCSYCSNISPQFHTEECPFPEKKSLFLTIRGIFYYIIQNTKQDLPENLQNLKDEWLNNTITQELLNKFLLVPNSVRVNEKKLTDRVPLNDELTKIQYLDVVKLRGPTKLEYTTATQKFSNAIMLSYQYGKGDGEDEDDTEDIDLSSSDTKKTSIRIYNNGLINLINVPSSSYYRKILYETLIDRINEVYESVNIDHFNRVVSEFTEDEYDEYTIIDEISYIHSVNSQFNLWPVKNKYTIDFRRLNDLISPLNSSGKIVSGEFTEVKTSSKGNKQIIQLSYRGKSINIINWEHILGKETKTQTLSREEIKCIILPIDGIKISLQIHKHGTFQMSMSYCNATDLKHSICSRVLDKSDYPLDFRYFDVVRSIFSGIFTDKQNLSSLSIDFTEDIAGAIKTTVSGKAPPNKPGTSTAVCRNNDPRPGYPSPRPIPYSFQGKCPESRQYIDPIGVLGNDGLYYPCCSAKTKKSEEEYKKFLVDGFPKNEREAREYGVNSMEDTKSGVLVPGSLNIGARTRAKIGGEWIPVKILGYKGKSKKPQEIIVQNEETNKVLTIDRQNLERDTRYFPGLRSLTKDQLIRCILKNLQYKKKDMTILELENLNDIKELINIPDTNFNPTLSVYGISIFEKIKYNVTSVPNTSNIYYLYITPTDSYFINTVGNKKEKSLTETINENIILYGFLEESSDRYFVTDILYFNRKVTVPFTEKLEMLKEIQDSYFLTDNSIEFCEYESNIIKGSKDLLQENSEVLLVFTPETNYTNIKVWGPIEIEPEITLQVLRKVKTNYFILGYENTGLSTLTTLFNNIFIQKAFIDANQVKINDYILFKLDYNLQTGQLSTRIVTPIDKTIKPQLTLNETLIKLSLLLNPIKESFFVNNRIGDSYIWSVPGKDKILTYVSDQLPLTEYSE